MDHIIIEKVVEHKKSGKRHAVNWFKSKTTVDQAWCGRLLPEHTAEFYADRYTEENPRLLEDYVTCKACRKGLGLPPLEEERVEETELRYDVVLDDGFAGLIFDAESAEEAVNQTQILFGIKRDEIAEVRKIRVVSKVVEVIKPTTTIQFKESEEGDK